VKAIGQTFSSEIFAAGLNGLPFSWGDDGTIHFDQAMTTAQIAAVAAVYAEHDPTALPIPTITKAQALLWLLSVGKTAANVQTAINEIADATARSVAQIEWDERQPFRRSHPLFDAIGGALGLSAGQIDAAFRAAALL
jgi:hypothetical protein